MLGPKNLLIGFIGILPVLAACGDGSAAPTTPTAVPIPTPIPGAPPITDFTPLAGLTKNTQVKERYFSAVHLWRAPVDRPYTAEDTATPVESFTRQDAQIGLHLETTAAFVPGMLVSYRVDKRAYGGDGEEASLASVVKEPGVFDVLLDAPEDKASYVVRFFLNGILVENLTFEIT